MSKYKHNPMPNLATMTVTGKRPYKPRSTAKYNKAGDRLDKPSVGKRKLLRAQETLFRVAMFKAKKEGRIPA